MDLDWQYNRYPDCTTVRCNFLKNLTQFEIIQICSGPDRYYDYQAIYDPDAKISPDVDQSCVFPFVDGYGDQNGCRNTEDFEERGLEDSKYKVLNLLILKKKKTFQ